MNAIVERFFEMKNKRRKIKKRFFSCKPAQGFENKFNLFQFVNVSQCTIVE